MPCFTAVTSHLAGCQRQTLHIFQRSPSTKATRTRDTFESLNKNITNIDGCIPVSIHNHTMTAFVGTKEYAMDLDSFCDIRLIMIFLIKLLGVGILELTIAGGMQP